VGEAGSGKTLLLSKIISIITALGVPATVVDLAPEKGGVGAKLARYLDVGALRYFTDDFRAPRIEGRDAEEELALARANAARAEALLKRYLEEPTPVLAVNDVTIYLHAGSLEFLLDVAERAEVFLATAYYGSRLRDKGSGIAERERRAVEELMKICDVFRL